MSDSEKQIKEVQSVALEIFREFIRICETLNLQYYILGGTLLGAVRHKGFIPWDDDIDVGMVREDYDIFVREAGKMLPPHLFLQTYQTDREYHTNAAKIRNNNTTFIENVVRHSDINHGMYLDIFPLDYYPDGALALKCTTIAQKILTVRIGMAFDVERNESWFKRMCKSILRLIFPDLYSAVDLRNRLYSGCRKSTRRTNYCGAWGKKEIVPAQWYAESCVLEFEGLQVTGPKDYDKWLTQFYGDYMQLPPVEQRVPRHDAVLIDAHTPYTEYADRYKKKKK